MAASNLNIYYIQVGDLKTKYAFFSEYIAILLKIAEGKLLSLLSTS